MVTSTIDLLEQESSREPNSLGIEPEINIDYLVKSYKKEYPGEAIWRLSQDIQQQVKVYHNIIEELKRPIDFSSNQQPDVSQILQDRAKQIRLKYESLGLVPTGILPNPSHDRLMELAFSKIRKFTKALIKIASSFSYELSLELNFQAGIQMVFEVQLSIPPALTVGIGGQVAKGGAIGASISGNLS